MIVWVPLKECQPIDTAIDQWRMALTGEGDRGLGKKSVKVDTNKPGTSPQSVLRQRIWNKLDLDSCIAESDNGLEDAFGLG